MSSPLKCVDIAIAIGPSMFNIDYIINDINHQCT
jgi:hypothetical protein